MRRSRLRAWPALAALLLALVGAGAASQDEEGTRRQGPVYDVRFDARIVPTERIARAEIRLRGGEHVTWMRFAVDPERHLEFSGDGEIEMVEEGLLWTPPRSGGTLRYVFRIDHLRTRSSYDARCADNWALFRAGDLFPPARVRMADGARSKSTVRLRPPAGWSLATPWPKVRGSSSIFAIENPDRSFDRPTGWVVMGKIGVLRETVAGTKVTVAGPVGQNVRRQDVLAFLRWTLPSVREVFGRLPERLLLVSAGDPMWRGGLSGPDSAYLHAARPLIAYDGTSPVLHELGHVAMSARSGPKGDWIAEGFAEYYALELLARSGTQSRDRVREAFGEMAQRGREAPRLDVKHASGDVTARAATVLRALDTEIRGATDDRASLDDVTRLLVRWDRKLTAGLLRTAAEQVADRSLAEFFRRETGSAPVLVPSPDAPVPPAEPGSPAQPAAPAEDNA